MESIHHLGLSAYSTANFTVCTLAVLNLIPWWSLSAVTYHYRQPRGPHNMGLPHRAAVGTVTYESVTAGNATACPLEGVHRNVHWLLLARIGFLTLLRLESLSHHRIIRRKHKDFCPTSADSDVRRP
jgi:hypothetical protein